MSPEQSLQDDIDALINGQSPASAVESPSSPEAEVASDSSPPEEELHDRIDALIATQMTGIGNGIPADEEQESTQEVLENRIDALIAGTPAQTDQAKPTADSPKPSSDPLEIS